MFKNIVPLLMLILASCLSLNGQILYVNENTPCTSGCNGLSWMTAFDHLQDALDVANIGTEIWVAAGTYKPIKDPFGNASPVDARFKTFYLVDGLSIYGGFNGTESSRSMRNPQQNQVILSGNIGSDTTDADNAYHVLVSIKDSNEIIISGFTIRDGNANEPFTQIVVEGTSVKGVRGSALLAEGSRVELNQCVLKDNFSLESGSGPGGGAILMSTSTFDIDECEFLNNARALQLEYSNLTLSNSVFFENYNTVIYSRVSDSELNNNEFRNNIGPIVFHYAQARNPIMTINNCLFSGNGTPGGSGSILFTSNVPNPVGPQDTAKYYLNNCTFTQNYMAAIGNSRVGRVYANNCIFWRDSSATFAVEISNSFQAKTFLSYCLLDDGTPGNGSVELPQGTIDLGGLIDEDPLFVSPPPLAPTMSGDMHLSSQSPCINAGDNGVATPTDLDGNPRIVDGNIDIGCYEYDLCLAPPKTIFVDSAASGNGDGASWANAFSSLAAALENACMHDTIYVARGTYLPDTTDLANLRQASFSLISHLAIFGGFNPATGDTFIQSRNIFAHPTVLSGDIGLMNDSSDNCYQVVTARDIANSSLDGFFIRDGRADHTLLNSGGGLFNINSELIVSNCIFSNNSSTASGNAVYNTNSTSNLEFRNCLFYENYPIGSDAFAIKTSNFANTTVINSTFSKNDGCLFSELFGESNILNSICWDNGVGSPIGLGGIWPGTISASYSLIQGGYAGVGNLNVDPLFIDPVLNDFSLQPSSPCIDSANSLVVPSNVIWDISGKLRIQNGIVDMGAHEYGAFHACPHPDMNSLARFYVATNGYDWSNNLGWGSNCDPCGLVSGVAWHGLICDSNRVTEIHMDNNNLTGQLPDEIGNFDALHILDIRFNDGMSGGIPFSIGELQNLKELYLIGNSLSGSLSAAISQLSPTLTHLDLRANEFSGMLPNWLDDMVNLRLLNLSINNFHGSVKSSLSALTSLKHLGLDDNNLSGQIPNFFDQMPDLEYATFSFNNFTGTIPTTLTTLSNLEILRLEYNDLSGTIPNGFDALNNLQQIRLSNNADLTGCYPGNFYSLCSQLHPTYSTNEWISDSTLLHTAWEDYCPCSQTNTWIGATGSWDVPANWSLGHVPKGCETVVISGPTSIVSAPLNYHAQAFDVMIDQGAQMTVELQRELTVYSEEWIHDWDGCD